MNKSEINPQNSSLWMALVAGFSAVILYHMSAISISAGIVREWTRRENAWWSATIGEADS
jgi:hypothetical protein